MSTVVGRDWWGLGLGCGGAPGLRAIQPSYSLPGVCLGTITEQRVCPFSVFLGIITEQRAVLFLFYKLLEIIELYRNPIAVLPPATPFFALSCLLVLLPEWFAIYFENPMFCVLI